MSLRLLICIYLVLFLFVISCEQLWCKQIINLNIISASCFLGAYTAYCRWVCLGCTSEQNMVL